MIIFFAGRPQTGQTSPRYSCSKGMQRLETPASSFIFSSHYSSPHHMVLTKPPPRLSMMSFTSSTVEAV